MKDNYLEKIKDWMRSQTQESDYYQFEWRCSNCYTHNKSSVKKGIRINDENPKCKNCICERYR